MGAAAIFDATKPRLEMRTGTTLRPQFGDNNQLYSFWLKLDTMASTGRSRRKPWTFGAVEWDTCARAVLEILNKVQGNGLSCCGDGLACDVCAIGKSARQAHPKRAIYNAKFPFQLVFTDLMGPISPLRHKVATTT